MSDLATAIDTYFAMWNEEDPEVRARLIDEAWTPFGSYLDPMLEAEGHQALSVMVDGVHAQFPGQRFTRTSGIDAHHGQARFAWQLAAPDGTVTVAGVDIAVIADDGRLAGITGFFGDVPDLDAA